MKKLAKTFLILTVISFLMFWITWGLFMAVSPPISFGFSPTPPPSFWQNSLFFAFVVLGMPMSFMHELVGHDGSRLVFVLLSLANSVVWGLCIGFPIYAIKRRFFTHAARPIAAGDAGFPPRVTAGPAFYVDMATMCTPLVLALLVVSLIFVGCSRSGDFGSFFVGEVIKYGQQPKMPITVSRLDARWKVQTDNDGFRVLVRGQPFAPVDALMRQVFGAPKVSGDSQSKGQSHKVYYRADIDLAAQCVEHADEVEIICVKGTSMWWPSRGSK